MYTCSTLAQVMCVFNPQDYFFCVYIVLYDLHVLRDNSIMFLHLLISCTSLQLAGRMPPPGMPPGMMGRGMPPPGMPPPPQGPPGMRGN